MIFGSVAELGDIGYQKATWLDPEMQNPHFTFGEFFECFYDAGAGDYEAIDPNSARAPFKTHVDQGHISAEERDIVWRVHLALKDYQEPGDAYDHASILADPKWLEVVSIARKATEQLREIFADPVDQTSLENKLPPPEQKKWPQALN
tara:strand:+ start:569 stop:1012 length:444 start_codon:yes stop_codon:yes gene_type:complete